MSEIAFIIGIPNLLNSANEQTETTDDDQLQKAKKGRAIQVNKKINDRFHAGQCQYECSACAVHGTIHGVGELLIGRNGQVPRKACSRGGCMFRGMASRQEVIFGINDGGLRLCGRNLKPEDDENQGNDWVGQPRQRKDMGKLKIWSERRCE